MSEWKIHQFEELFAIPLKNGLTKPSGIRGHGTRMINMKEIFAYDKIDDLTHMECVPLSETEKNSLLQYNDLLFARQSLVESGAGKIAIFKGKNETVFESHLIRCRLDVTKANSEFVYYLFKSPIGKNTVSTIVTQTAAAGIKASDLKTLRFQIPQLSEQTAIAEVLSSLDDKIDLLHRQNKTLEQLAETHFRQWFVEEASWENGRLGDILELVYGKTLKEENRKGMGFPVVGSSGIVGYHDEFYVEGPGIVIGRKGTLGRVIYLFENFFPIDTTYFIKSKNKSAGLYFEFFLLKTLNFEEMNSDSAVPGLNRDIALSSEVKIPPEERISEFNNHCSTFFQKIKSNTTQINTLTQLRDTLLPKLMSGEVRVKM